MEIGFGNFKPGRECGTIIAMRKGRVHASLYIASVVIVLGLIRFYAGYSREAADTQWYLLTPPVRDGSGASDRLDKYEPDVTAPLWNWEIRESYASRNGCEAARAHKLAQFAKESDSLKALANLDCCVAANARGVPHSNYWWDAHPEYLIDGNPPPRDAISRLLNQVAVDSRTHPGMSVMSRLFEYWVPLLFAALFVYYPINLVVGVYSGAELSRKEAAMLADLLVGLECFAVQFVLLSPA